VSGLVSGVGAARLREARVYSDATVVDCRNASVERLRGVEGAALSFPGTVDAEIVEFVSGTTTSHPDILLQNRLQEALDAKTAADTRRDALTVSAAVRNGGTSLFLRTQRALTDAFGLSRCLSLVCHAEFRCAARDEGAEMTLRATAQSLSLFCVYIAANVVTKSGSDAVNYST
jgi:hypothetical protein